MALNAYARTATDRVVVPIARGLVRVGVTANWLTFAGLVLTFVGGAVILMGQPFWGSFIATIAALVDAFDGTVARLRGTQSAFGSFYDSVADRISDATLFSVAAWLVRDQPILFAITMVALVGAQLTSYIRAKAESLGWDATVGLVERPERLAVILLGLGLEQLQIAMTVLAVGGVITIAQRLRAVLAQADRT